MHVIELRISVLEVECIQPPHLWVVSLVCMGSLYEAHLLCVPVLNFVTTTCRPYCSKCFPESKETYKEQKA